jgi:AGZA family xanthine/uracil permease-like MFS transporter
MNAAGVPYSDAVFATAVSAGVANVIVGFMGNLPFGLAPGVGLSAYLAYGVVLSGLGTLQECMTACFASGALLLLCALVGLTSIIMWVVPKYIKVRCVA